MTASVWSEDSGSEAPQATLTNKRQRAKTTPHRPLMRMCPVLLLHRP